MVRHRKRRDDQELGEQLAALELYLEKARAIDRKYQLLALGAKIAIAWTLRAQLDASPLSFLEMLALYEGKRDRALKTVPVIVWLNAGDGVDEDLVRRLVEQHRIAELERKNGRR